MPKKLSEEKIGMIIRLRQQGATWSDVAYYAKVSKTGAQRYYNNYLKEKKQ